MAYRGLEFDIIENPRYWPGHNAIMLSANSMDTEKKYAYTFARKLDFVFTTSRRFMAIMLKSM